MADIIRLLPEHVANQIAAGEVVQRPASVVKELMENAIDAGATNVRLIVKDAGRTLIQVIDNGKGMSPTDARMCFERHATSKIKDSADIFQIATKGFRGEAMAAISAVAQVEMKTRQQSEELGTLILNEGNSVTLQEPCSTPQGTSVSVKNLFFNVPARRNFLKEDSVELKHIIDEFERVALTHPEISFSLHSNGNEIFVLPASVLINRIIGVFGSKLKNQLVYFEEDTPRLKMRGYVGRPDSAKKKKDQQFIFVNNRFIRNAYLNHAIVSAYEGIIAQDVTPPYFVYLEMPASSIDINIHPTKTEIKFEDEKTIYAMLKTAAKRCLGKNNLAPSLDFETEQSFDIDFRQRHSPVTPPTISVNPNYNPFHGKASKEYDASLYKANVNNWQSLYMDYVDQPNPPKYEDQVQTVFQMEQDAEQMPLFEQEKYDWSAAKFFQLGLKYIVLSTERGVMLIDQQRAHERVLFEHYMNALKDHALPSQRELFPNTLELSAGDMVIIHELKPDLEKLGFELEDFGKNEIVIHGIPAEMQGVNSASLLEGLLENYKLNNLDVKMELRENLAQSMARSSGIKYGKSLQDEEIRLLLAHLFECEHFNFTPSGKNILSELPLGDLDKLFRKR